MYLCDVNLLFHPHTLCPDYKVYATLPGVTRQHSTVCGSTHTSSPNHQHAMRLHTFHVCEYYNPPSLCSICTYAQPNWPSPKLVQLDCMSVFNLYRLYHSMGRNVMHCVLCLHHCIVDLHYCGLCSEYRAQAAWVLQKAFHIQSMHQCHLYMCLQFSLYAQIQEIIRTLVTPSNVVNCFDP